MSAADAAPARKAAFGWSVLWSLGSIGTGVYSTVPGLLLLYYMTQVLAVPVDLASLAVLVPKLAIMVVEPLIGVWSDRTRSPWGRRRPFLLLGALLSAAAFVVLFNTPQLGDPLHTLLAVGLAYLAASLTYSIFAVPYVAMPAEIADSPRARAHLTGLRMLFVFTGVLIGAAVPSALIEPLGGGALGYGRMAFVIAGICLIATLAAFFAAARLPSKAPSPVAERKKGGLGFVLRYPPYIAALLAYIVMTIGSGVGLAAVPYFAEFVLGRPQSDVSLMVGIQVISALVSILPWAFVTPRLGFTLSLIISVAFGALASTLLWFAPDYGRLAVLAGFALNGVSAGGQQVAAFALLADVTSRATRDSGVGREGMMTGLWTASEKVALAIGPSICGLVLAAGGFISAHGRADQPATALTAAHLATTAAPGAFFGLAIVVLMIARRRLDPPQAKA